MTLAVVLISERSGEVVHRHELEEGHWQENSVCVLEFRDVGILTNATYTANVSVSTLAGQEISTFSFGKLSVIRVQGMKINLALIDR